MATIKAGIIGATGYTGSELVRLLTFHSEVKLEIVTSESKAGQKFSDIHPQYTGIADMELQPMETLKDHKLDVVFLALPHGVSMDFVKEWGTKHFSIIDLSGDFRLKSTDVYEAWYHKKHSYPKGVEQAVFGLPELNRDKIRQARLVGNPGCYPTSVILALAPLIQNGHIDPTQIIADSKSGVTGAGATAKDITHFPEVFGNFTAYGIGKHRHTPEIQTALSEYTKEPVELLFTPHLLPIDRGILSTTYSNPVQEMEEELLQEVFDGFYEKEYFVRVLDEPPSLKHVRGSNYADLYVTYDQRSNRIITVSAIDNLVKGAAGQAIQNMNIMFGMLESTGLKQAPLSP